MQAMNPRVFLADDSVGGWQWSDGSGAPAIALAQLPTDDPSLRSRVSVAAIVPAARMRTLAVAIPPAAGDKLDAVVRFALEDQLAGDVELQHVVIAARRATDALVHVIDRRWLVDAIDRLGARGVVVGRIAAESDLAPRDDDALTTWIYRDDGGFMIERSGKVTTLDRAGDALPSGLLLAVDRASSRTQAPGATRGASAPGAMSAATATTAPAVVRENSIAVHGPATLRPRIDGWTRATGMPFDLHPDWSWLDASKTAVDESSNLLTPALRRTSAARIERPRSPWRAAVGWLIAAFVVQAGATAIAWGGLQWRVTSLERETAAAIRAAAPDLEGDTRSAWRTYYTDYRHRAGKPAPDDALPMLADAADGLREIGIGAVRAVTFDGGQLTIDFERSATAAIASALPRWSEAGLAVLQAETPAGIRVRLTRQ